MIPQISDEIVAFAKDAYVVVGAFGAMMVILYGAARAWEDLQSRRRANRVQARDDVTQALDVKDDVAESYKELLKVQLQLHDAQWEQRLQQVRVEMRDDHGKQLSDMRSAMEAEHRAAMDEVRGQLVELRHNTDLYGCERAPACSTRTRLGALRATNEDVSI